MFISLENLIGLGIIVGLIAAGVYFNRRWRAELCSRLIQHHFSPTPVSSLRITTRTFPRHVHADLQRTLEQLLAKNIDVKRLFGFQAEYYVATNFGQVATNSSTILAPNYHDVDIGESQPVRCLEHGVWLATVQREPFALMVTQFQEPCRGHFVSVQMATRQDEAGQEFSRTFFERLEKSLQQSGCYRGKIISFEAKNSYSGEAAEIVVHKLREVERDAVILPAATLDQLDRNVVDFVRMRPKLKAAGLPTKKGLLFYGPPGTGKTHTIHYLTRSLAGHTTLLITAEQVQFLTEYMTLARLLQPSLVVIEDVDLIARDRRDMQDPRQEILLNKLLNEMDGLREDAEILFVLTTNRPESLEAAIAARPGRIDQAIEFPLPDDVGRAKLIRLYARNMLLADELVQKLAARTAGVSAAFVKELMRRTAQYWLERDGNGEPGWSDIEHALDEMLVRGGPLNRLLLGATNALES